MRRPMVHNFTPDTRRESVCEREQREHERGADDWQAGKKQLCFACRGYPATDGRVPIEQLTVPHEHDMAKHENEIN